MTTTTNDIRAARFSRLLVTYDTGDTPRDTLIDLLADLRHWCLREGVSLSALDRIAQDYFASEVNEEARS